MPNHPDEVIRTVTTKAPPPASEVLQPKSTTDAQIADRGVDLGLVGRTGSITSELFPPGVLFELMLGNRLDAIRLLRAFSITNELIADAAIDQRTIGDGQVQENHLSPELTGLLANLRLDVDFAGVPQEGGISADAAINLIRRNAVNSITSTGGTITVTNPTAGVYNLEATGESEAVGAPTSLSHSLAGRVLTTTLGRSGQSDLTADVTLPVSEDGGGGGDSNTVDWAQIGNTDPIPADKLTNAPSGTATVSTAEIASAVASYLQANPPGISTAAISAAVATYLENNPIVAGVSEARAEEIATSRINNTVFTWARGSGSIPLDKVQTALNSFLGQSAVTQRITSVINDSHIASWFRRKVRGS